MCVYEVDLVSVCKSGTKEAKKMTEGGQSTKIIM